MDEILNYLPTAENVVTYVSFLAISYAVLKKQVEKLIVQGNAHETSIAVVKEQIDGIKKKLDNGLSSQIKDTSERVARIEGHCELSHCKDPK